MSDQDDAHSSSQRLNGALRRVVLLKETGPKSAAWHRARVSTIWRLHRLLETSAEPRDEDAPAEDAPPRQP